MERLERHTRKPRLFRVGRYQKTSAVILLALGSQLAVAAPPATLHAEAGSVVVEARVAQPQEEFSTGMQTGSHPERLSSRPEAMPTPPRGRIGWAFALLLAGVAVGRHTSANDAELER